MKHWQETRQVLDRLDELRSAGMASALATVVSVKGSAYRREGAQLLIAEDGGTTGNVSGGCLEEAVREVGLRVLRTRRSELHHYCSGADEIGAWNLGLGCDGQVEVRVAPSPGRRERQRELLEGDEPFAVCSFVADGMEAGFDDHLVVTADGVDGSLLSPELAAGTAARVRALPDGTGSRVYPLAGRRVFVERFEPPAELVVVGAGLDAPPIARIAHDAGFRVVVVDWREALLRPDRFPAGVRLVCGDADRLAERLTLRARSYVILATHNFAADGWYLPSLLKSPAPYIGILGPRARSERLLQGLDPGQIVDPGRIHGPVGLDLGGEGAEQVALAIVAEVLAAHRGRTGAPLREKASADLPFDVLQPG